MDVVSCQRTDGPQTAKCFPGVLTMRQLEQSLVDVVLPKLCCSVGRHFPDRSGDLKHMSVRNATSPHRRTKRLNSVAACSLTSPLRLLRLLKMSLSWSDTVDRATDAISEARLRQQRKSEGETSECTQPVECES